MRTARCGNQAASLTFRSKELCKTTYLLPLWPEKERPLRHRFEIGYGKSHTLMCKGLEFREEDRLNNLRVTKFLSRLHLTVCNSLLGSSRQGYDSQNIPDYQHDARGRGATPFLHQAHAQAQTTPFSPPSWIRMDSPYQGKAFCPYIARNQAGTPHYYI